MLFDMVRYAEKGTGIQRRVQPCCWKAVFLDGKLQCGQLRHSESRLEVQGRKVNKGRVMLSVFSRNLQGTHIKWSIECEGSAVVQTMYSEGIEEAVWERSSLEEVVQL